MLLLLLMNILWPITTTTTTVPPLSLWLCTSVSAIVAGGFPEYEPNLPNLYQTIYFCPFQISKICFLPFSLSEFNQGKKKKQHSIIKN